jgi:hypothetical protein
MADDPKKIVLAGGEFSAEQDVSLLDILDHVLNTGVVIQGSLVVSLAGVDLLYVGLNAVITSVETALKTVNKPR